MQRQQRRPSATFQSTQPRGLRLRSAAFGVILDRFQSTQPRGLRRRRLPAGNPVDAISIHAAARAATSATTSISLSIVFQSTQPRGLRRRVQPLLCNGFFYFNPRSREGCDSVCRRMDDNVRDFNPRSREGCDDFNKHPSASITYFNPRSREGCDSWRLQYPRQDPYFNPRSREGCDMTICHLITQL